MKLNFTRTNDGRLAITQPIYRSFNTQADADKFEAWLVAFCCRAAARVVTEDELFKGSVAHPDARSDYERTKAKELRRYELEALRPKVVPQSVDQQIDNWLSERVEREQLSKLTTSQRMQLQHRREMMARQVAEVAQAADSELRSRPEYIAAAAEIERIVLAARFNERLTAEEVENLEHLAAVLDVSGSVEMYRESKRVFDVALRERVNEEQARQFAAISDRTKSDLMLLSVADVPNAEPEPIPEPVDTDPHFTAEPQFCGWDAHGRKLMRLFHDKGESVISEDLLKMNSTPAEVLRVIETNPKLVREIARPAPQPEAAQ